MYVQAHTHACYGFDGTSSKLPTSAQSSCFCSVIAIALTTSSGAGGASLAREACASSPSNITTKHTTPSSFRLEKHQPLLVWQANALSSMVEMVVTVTENWKLDTYNPICNKNGILKVCTPDICPPSQGNAIAFITTTLRSSKLPINIHVVQKLVHLYWSIAEEDRRTRFDEQNKGNAKGRYWPYHRWAICPANHQPPYA